MDSLMKCPQNSINRILKKYIPILSWLPDYNLEDFKGDFIAGFTVGLTVVPQGLALAQLANLPPQYGLYTAFMGSFMYAIFGTCKDLVIGPTSVMALMTAQYAQIGGPAYAALLAFLSGCFQLLLGIFNLGILMDFISAPVLSGFTSAAAIITATMQLKGIFGLKYESRGFMNTVYYFFQNIPRTNLYDMCMGITSIIFLLLLRKFKDQKCTCCTYMKGCNTLHGLWWSLATARNALLVIICSGFASACLAFEKDFFSLTQRVDAGIPPFQIPQFSFEHFDPESNSTVYKNCGEVLKDLGSGIIVIPFLSLLEAVAIAKTFTKGEKLHATREMIALGMGNLMGSFVSSYPVTGSFSRSVINNTSGVRTPLGGVVSGSFVLLALCVIAPLFHYIPKSCLSAIIFSAVIFMIHFEDIPEMWKTNKVELIPFFTTFLLSFIFGLEYGLLFGIAAALGILLKKQNEVDISVATKTDENGLTYIHITPESSIYFPSADKFKGVVSKALYSQSNIPSCTVVIHGDNMKEIDYTTAMGVKNMVKGIRKDNAQVLFQVTEPSAVKALNCLEDSVRLCAQEDEIKHSLLNSASNTCTEIFSDGNEVLECVDPLLNKYNMDKVVEHLNTKDNHTQKE
ncbi:sodium-independent sulfate anion transporter-like isoform X1 [Argiope bruennichi]|uniref:sodium-independent sulfate anion transporter-like isoform X1 n=1 Tax=Argiope bruennichi TaxID=94029 RepID=UPI002493D835|nr:sodium-independent sulfate anion transporter-like isoform X1 [Argiope bruennichi]XP_055939797.1 sodium-independent sulfate anion transporter-like isoform X1 [Argiope bruennichi]XP_055939798.1 sodium-independent sulfate anion transporter-like isoform X1 [Argiope bruennichi]